MTNFDVSAKPEHETPPIDALSSPFERCVDWVRRRRLDKAAKCTAMLTACGQTLTPDQRALKVGFGILFEGLTLLLWLVFIWFNAVFFFLQSEKVEMSRFKPTAALWFSDKFAGQSADLESLEVQYRKEDGALALVAKHVEIRGEGEDVLFTLPKLDSQFDLEDLFFGKFIPRRTSIEGGAVTGIITKDGSIQFGLGTPDSFENLGADFSIDKSRSGKPGRYAWKSIEDVALTDVSVFVINNKAGLTHHFSDVNGAYTYENSILTAKIDANMNADTPVPLQIEFDSDDSFELIKLKLAMQGFNPSALDAQSQSFAHISGLDAPIDGAINVTLGAGGALDDLELSITAGQGQWSSPTSEPAPFEAAELSAKYDVLSGRVDVKTMRLKSKRLSFSGSGRVTSSDGDSPLGVKKPFNMKLNLTDINAEPGPNFEGPFEAKALTLDAGVNPAVREGTIKALNIEKDHFRVSLTGDVAGKRDEGPFELSKLNLKGSAQGDLTQSDVMKYWPRSLSPASRDWVLRSILKADVSRVDLDLGIDEETLARGRLNDDELTVSFPLRNATVKYITTMTPMTQAMGSGVLRGNSFSVGVDAGRLGDTISVTDSRVDINQFFPVGGKMKVVVNAQGELPPLLRFIDEPPFGFATRFGLKPEEFSGSGSVNYIFTRPVGMPDRVDLRTHTVSADFSDVTAPIKIGPHGVNNGRLHLDLNAEGLKIFGPVNVGPWPAQYSLTDMFDDGMGNAAHRLTGTMTRDDFDRLGIGLREYFSGDVDVTLDAKGNGLAVDGAIITADLTKSDLRFDTIWSKPAGQEGRLSAALSRNELGGAQISDLQLQAAGLDIQGGAKFGPDLRLLSLNLPVAKVAGFIDSAVIASTPQAGALALTLRGEYLNLEPWVVAAMSPESQSKPFPLGLSGDFKRLNVRNKMELTNAKMGLKNTNAGFGEFSLTGMQNEKPLWIEMKAALDGARDLNLEVPDAGAVMGSFFDLKNITGGQLKLEATLPPPGAPGGVTGMVTVDDFKLIDAPVFARMLSLASLSGLGEVLSGDGMNFEKLYAPFTFEEQQITVKDARASGPAVGITASGSVDFDGKTMDVAGALVPAYTFNSALGNVPLLGDIIVGKDGEGIFALNYTVEGSFEKTQVAVNPLSAFAPGFLRRIFDPSQDAPAKKQK